MATKSFERNIVIEDKVSIAKFKSALKSENSINLNTSIKDIKKEEIKTENKIISSILGRY